MKFVSDILKIIKFHAHKISSPKYKRMGQCKQCGTCCRNITLSIGKEFIKTQQQFELLKEWDKKYENFDITGKDDEGILLFTCKALAENNRCTDYIFRSWYCRAYPIIKTNFIAAGETTLEGCGFYLKPSKSFQNVYEDINTKNI